VLNDGQWASYQPPGSSGGLWPRGSNNSVIFNAGLWIGFIDDDGSYRMAGVQHGSDFKPGPYGSIDSESNNDYRVYKVNRWDDVTNIDWAEWPIDLGAPWEDVDGDGAYNPGDKPFLPLDQTLFTVYSDSGEHQLFGGSPIGAEIRQTIYGGASSTHNDLSRTFYVKYEIINRDTVNWNNPRFAVWSDPDLGNAGDDLIGVDADSNLMYVYNGNDQDDVFPIPPAVGFKYISGLNSLNDNLYAAGAMGGNLTDVGDYNYPNDQEQAYNRMLGLQNNGSGITDPSTGQNTTFMMNGDPVSGTGWADENAADRGIFMSVSANPSEGESTAVVAPGDTVGFVFAVIVAQGIDRLNSITELRDASNEAKILWDNNFAGVTLVDRPVLEPEDNYGLFNSISLDNVESGGTTELTRTYHNTGNSALNISISISNDNYSIIPTTATISAGGSQSFSFSYTADNFTFSSLNVPSDYGTIQSAVDAAMVTSYSENINMSTDDPYITPAIITNYGYSGSGDTVYVSPGTYTENVTIDKSVNLIATADDPVSTIIDGGHNGLVITVNSGGGLFTLNGFTIQNGQSDYVGGGILVEWGYNMIVEIKNNIIKDNYASVVGGGLYSWNATGSVTRNIFTNNSTGEGGNAARLNNGGINFYNNTLWENDNSLYVRSSDHRIINNIIWDNDDHEFILVNNNPTIEYNIVKNGYDGTGNISDNPQFYDPDNNDFTLSASSPAIDAGHPDLDQDGVNWESDPDDQDLDGTRMDIGCCTFLPEVSLAELSVAEVSAIHGDTVLVDIFIDEVTSELSSIDLSFSGFQDKLTLVDIIADGSSLMGANDWTIQYNDTEDLLITAAAGAQDIIQGGKLFSLEMAVHDTLVSQYIPVEIVHYLGNDNLIEYTATSGGVHVLWLPEAGFSADVTSGDYPLTVTFIDTSVSGTYPIIDRQWDFGNDSTGGGDTVSMIYNYPGIYDVGLSVVDEFGLSDTLVKYNYIQVDTVFGDIDFNAIVETEDAYTVLSHVVGLTELDSLEFVIADVSTNSSLSPLDATLILQYLNGDIAVLPFVPGPGFEATGQVQMEDQDADPDMMLDIPVNLTNGSNIYGFTGTIQYDPAVVELDTILFSNVLQNYLVSANPLSPGVIILSAAGIASAGESDVIAVLSVYVTEAFSEATSITITDLSWNEGEAVELAAEMTINFGLSVDGLQLPDVYALHQNYPNPFNPFTTLRYDLPENAMVNITIYDMMGRVVKTMVNSEQEAGFKSIQWDGTNHAGATVSAGLYLYTIQADNFHQTKKMILLK